MSETTRRTVLDFHEAFYAGNFPRALELCTEDIDLIAYAPVDLLPHLGHKRGREQVAATWATLHNRYSHMRYEIPFMAVEDDRAACIMRIFFRKNQRDRILQTDVAEFYTLRDGRIAQIRQFMDSFNVVEQVLERDISALLKAGQGH